jgi:hypothetical protein
MLNASVKWLQTVTNGMQKVQIVAVLRITIAILIDGSPIQSKP